MEYDSIIMGTFIARPNRFIAHIMIEGSMQVCHVKNTSRLQELLLPNTPVAVQHLPASHRKTAYDLIAVLHEGRWVNIDSQAPNKVFGEWLAHSGYFSGLRLIRPETSYGNSRLDYYIEAENSKIFIEVKGVTLVENGIALFPGAPTARGVKHLQELVHCVQNGYEAMVAFIVKRQEVTACAPNDALDPAFGRALRTAAAQGVQVLALGCAITPASLTINRFVDVLL